MVTQFEQPPTGGTALSSFHATTKTGCVSQGDSETNDSQPVSKVVSDQVDAGSCRQDKPEKNENVRRAYVHLDVRIFTLMLQKVKRLRVTQLDLRDQPWHTVPHSEVQQCVA